MAQTSCNIFGRCRNRKTGKLTNKVSQLHKDLLGLGKIQKAFTRQKANAAFCLSQEPKFLEAFDDTIIFDSQELDAEPKLASFFEAAHNVLPELTYKDVRDLLAKKFKEGVYSYDEAYKKMESFNAQKDGGTSFIGTLVPQEDGKYLFKIAYNSIEEQNSLMQVLQDRINASNILQRLKNLKVGIVEGAKSLYDTKNPKVLSNGIKGIITLKGGEKAAAHNIKELAEETGHAIVGMLGEDNKFYKRLSSALEKHPEIASELLSAEEYDNYTLTSKQAHKEFMGHIVGRYLEQWESIKPKGILAQLGILIQRMVDWINSHLRLSQRDYTIALYKAKWAAYKMVKDFMGDSFQGTLQNAVSVKEQLQASGDQETTYTKLKEVLEELALFTDKTKDFSYKIHKNYKTRTLEITTTLNWIQAKQEEAIFDVEEIQDKCVEQYISTLNFLVQELDNAYQLLGYAMQGIDQSGKPLSLNEQAKIIKYAYSVNELSKKVCEEALLLKNSIYDEDKKEALEEAAALLTKVNTTIFKKTSRSGTIIEGSFGTMIAQARKNMALQLLTQISGEEFIAVAQHVSLKSGRIVRHNTEIVNIENLMDRSTTASWIDTYINSMADSPDITNQLIYRLVEQQRHKANTETLVFLNQLRALHGKLKIFGTTNPFFEVDDDNMLTGNLVSERHWGKWEAKYKKDKEAFIKDWCEANAHLKIPKNRLFADTRFRAAFGAWKETWHSENSTTITLKDEKGNIIKRSDGKDKKIKAPAISSDPNARNKNTYDSPQWEKLQKDPVLREWYKEYMAIKVKLDNMLPEGSTNALHIRAPQFTGTTAQRLRHAFRGSSPITTGFKAIGRETLIKFCMATPDEIEYGGDYNTLDEDDTQILEAGLANSKTKAVQNYLNTIDRVPLYGVRKLPNASDISTDLVQSTLAYAAMATSYKHLNGVAEAISQTIEQRTGNSRSYSVVQDMTKREMFTTLNQRARNYLEQQVFNKYTDVYTESGGRAKAKTKFTRKLVGKVARFGSVYMLGWNWHSALTNAYTAFNELFKEAYSGEEFSMSDFIWATGIFLLKNLGSWFCNVANIATRKGSMYESQTKLALFMRKMDVQNENERKFRDYHIGTPGWEMFRGFSYTNIALYPYQVTDVWMQTISYLAVARHTKLKNTVTGEKCSLWDAYTVVKDKNGKNTLQLKGKNDLERNSWTIFDKKRDLLTKALKEEEASMKTTVGFLDSKKAQALYEYRDVMDDDNHIITREPVIDPDTGGYKYKDSWVPFDDKQENLIRLQCRGINNRLHGVYNRGDGGAFSKFVITSLALSMKKYAIGLVNRRFSASRYDARTGTMRQGSNVTMVNIFWDCISGMEGMKDKEKFLTYIQTHKNNVASKVFYNFVGAIYGILKFAYIATMPSQLAGVNAYLRKAGYSENQIANVRRFFIDFLLPRIIDFMIHILTGPLEGDDDDDDSFLDFIPYWKDFRYMLTEQCRILFDEHLGFVSEGLNSLYTAYLKMVPWDSTIDDEGMLDEETLREAVEGGSFNLRQIIAFQLSRGLVEQDAYSPLRLASNYHEVMGWATQLLPGVTSCIQIADLAAALMGGKSEEELDNMDPEERKKYSSTGKPIYVKGGHKNWYKLAVKAHKIGPARTLEAWYNAGESMKSFIKLRGENYLDNDNQSLFEEITGLGGLNYMPVR